MKFRFLPNRGLAILLAVALLLPSGPGVVAQSGEDAQPRGEDSVFQRRDVPPAEVLSQLNFGGAIRGGELAPTCTFFAGEASARACMVEVAESAGFAFEGFGPGSVQVQITRPDGLGYSAPATVTARGWAYLPWTSVPGDPLGEHVVLATQGDLEARATFQVQPATGRRQAVVPEAGAPGTPFRVVLAGFSPNQPVTLRLYRDVADTFWYLADLPPVLTDARGEAVTLLPSRSTDPAGRYLVSLGPAAAGEASGAGFEIARDPALPPPSLDSILADLVLTATWEANRVWATVLADPARPAASLERVFAGERLAQAQAEVEALRAAGQTRQAQFVRPPVVDRVVELSRFRVEATVQEQWEDIVRNRDGSIAMDRSRTLAQRYALELRFEPCYCWFIVE